MKGDFTNIRRQPEKHYSSVRTQQGRVALDIDWNDQIEIQNHLDRAAIVDAIGPAGGPKGDNGGFQIGQNATGTDLSVAAGRYWVDGLLCELSDPTTYLTQPDLPNPPLAVNGALALANGTYVVYLDVWEAHVTYLDDADLQEPALRGVDTTTRTKVIWQVKLLAVSDPSGNGTCETDFPEWTQLITSPTGALSARAQIPTQASSCSVESVGGYRRLENQLYRVEIHKPGDQSSATFKFSRENGSIVADWTQLTSNILGVSSPGRDAVVGFSEGDWIELTDDDHERTATPGVLAKITQVSATQLTIDDTSLDPPDALNYSDFPHNPKVRRWEADLPTAVSAARPLLPTTAGDGFVDLEDGVQVKFESGSYGTGDYWVIPARTILGNVIWPVDPVANTPLTAPRLGTQHHFARLALLRKSSSGLSLASCYRPFPPLTDITAADVSYAGDCDALQGAETVQEALDLLCQETDLSFHKQNLHGWGIVNGLQVICGPDSAPAQGGPEVHDTITVKNGYAINANGLDVIVAATGASGAALPGDALKILDLIQSSNALPVDPSTGKLQDGSVTLTLNGGDLPGRYGVVPYDGSSQTWSGIFQDTFWLNVYRDSIVPIIDAFRDEFTGNSSATRSHVITFLNVLAQLLNPNAGARVFISAKEDQILRDFYNKLRAILQSKTFCAMFDGVTSGLPDYAPIYAPAAAGGPEPSTIFLPGTLSVPQKLRVDPAGKVGYLVSGDINIQIFDIQLDAPTAGANGQPVFPGTHEIYLSSTAFPTPGAVVQDVALASDSKTLYVLALLKDPSNPSVSDTVFATADVSDPRNPTWTSSVTTLCSTPLVNLIYAPSVDACFAIGPGKGLYQINPKILANPTPTAKGFFQLVSFNACGQLAIVEVGQQSLAFVTVGTAPTYTAIGRIDLRNTPLGPGGVPGNLAFTIILPGSGSDDLAVAFDPAGKFQRLFVVIDGTGQQTSKQLLSYNANTNNGAAPPDSQIPIRYVPTGTIAPSTSDSAVYRLGFEPSSSALLVLSTTDNIVQTYNIWQGGSTLTPLVYPSQNVPVFLAVGSTAGYVWVLNAGSNTINNVPLHYFAGTTPLINLAALAQYHTSVLKAFIDLFGQLAQYLKDSICDQLLVNGPSDSDRTLYLARIDVKGGQVYNICNFSRRKYVHSFPTVEYWLSIIPILPVLRKAVGDFCCSILQQSFFGYEPPAPNSRADFLSGSSVLRSASAVQAFDFKGFWNTEVVGRLQSAGSVGTSIVSAVAQRPATLAPAAGASRFDLRNQPVSNVTRALSDQGVVVTGTEPASPADLLHTIVAPARLAPGAQAVLVTDTNNRVVAVKPAPNPVATSANLQAALTARDQQLQQLTSQVQKLQADHQTALAERDQQLSSLAAQMAEVQKRVGELATPKARTTRRGSE